VSVEVKHHALFDALGKLVPPWAGRSGELPPPPKFGGSVVAAGSLTKWFGGAVRRADVIYRYRREMDDTGSSDDVLTFVVDPAKVDLPYMIDKVFPTIIASFDAYVARYGNDAVFDALPATDGLPVTTNSRYDVEFINPISFFDETLCRRAFKLSPDQIAARLTGNVENVRRFPHGVYVVATSRILSVEETLELGRRIRERLTDA
jgi:hypothetical protein